MKSIWNRVIHTVRKSDFVLYVLDARVPFETRSKKIERISKLYNKNLVFVITKTDLVPKEYAYEIKNKLINEGYKVFLTSYVNRTGILSLRKYLFRQANKKQDRIFVSVIGYPNVGKSSLINLITRKQSARKSSEPGYTKGEQWISIKMPKDNKGKVLFLDTPGVIPMDEKYSLLKGNLRPKECVCDEVYEFLSKIFSRKHNFFEIYEIMTDNEYDFVEKIAEKYNFRKKGNVPDKNRACIKIINDWNSGVLSSWD